MPNDRAIVTVANRLPIHRAAGRASNAWESSAGGLVTAMTSVMRGTEGAWVGWTGKAGDTPAPFTYDGMQIWPIPISKKEVECYYNGASNNTFWPLYHDAICAPEFHRQWWQPYRAVNERFAETAARVARERDVVWVHDYHLQLVPQMLRTLRPDLRIGFFLHIPFPPDELFEWLPWRASVADGLLGADLIGFQTPNAVHNFARVARAYTPATGEDERLSYLDRKVRVGSFPISIDTAWWNDLASASETKNKAYEIKGRVGQKRRLLLAVDRLDYTKGIVERLQAFEELLATGKASVEDCVLMQIAVPSRETVGDYARLRDTVEQMVGRINGEFGVPGRVAVHYFRRSHTREDLAAYYRAADVMLVTPLRDGMNLVAKEYIACRTDGTGVLVLSEFAGAAKELTEALIVNPRDTDQMAASFHAALTMDEAEARARMTALREKVQRHDVYCWANSFMEALEG